MNIEDAISVIESAAGFTDESTPVGEAWAEILSYIYQRPTQRCTTSSDDRDPECVARWPECYSDGYDPRCCRFPKSCSCVRFEVKVP